MTRIRNALLVASLALAAAVPAPAPTPITAFPNFADACYGYALPGKGQWGGFNCDTMPAGWIGFSVTQETPDGDHAGSANWTGPDQDYMADYSYPDDLGDWLDMGADAPGVVSLSLNTADYPDELNSQTGWPVPYGHTFVGLNDLTIANATLDKDIRVEFDVLVRSTLAPDQWPGFTGVRVLLGGVVQWKEPGRANRDHYFEVDLSQTDGYAASLGGFSGLPLCFDRAYDHCFYDPAGRYPEGRYLPYGKPVPLGTWVHVTVPYGKLVKALKWAAPPGRWRNARVTGLYVAIEGIGTHSTSLQVRGWNPYAR